MNRVLKTSASILVLAMALGGPSAVFAAPGDDNFNQSASTAFTGGPITTDARSWREVVLPDGTSVVVGPGSSVQASIENGAVRIAITQGSIRVTEGRNRGEAGPIVITTPDGRADLAGGSAVVRYRNGATTATLIFGRSLVLTSGGTTQTIIRPGFSSRFGSAGFVGSPDRQSPEEASLDVADVSPAPTVRMAQRSTQSARATSSNNNRRRDPTETGSIPGESNTAPTSQRTNRTNNRASQNSRIAALNTQTGLLTIGEDTDEQNGTGLNNGLIVPRQFQRGDAIFNESNNNSNNSNQNQNQNQTTQRLKIGLPRGLLGSAQITGGIETNTGTSSGYRSNAEAFSLGSTRSIRAAAELTLDQVNYSDMRAESVSSFEIQNQTDISLRQYLFRGGVLSISPFREAITFIRGETVETAGVTITCAGICFEIAGTGLHDIFANSVDAFGLVDFSRKTNVSVIMDSVFPSRTGAYWINGSASTNPSLSGKHVIVGRPVFVHGVEYIDSWRHQTLDVGHSAFSAYDTNVNGQRILSFGGAGPGQGGLAYAASAYGVPYLINGQSGQFLEDADGRIVQDYRFFRAIPGGGGNNSYSLPNVSGPHLPGTPGGKSNEYFVYKEGTDFISGYDQNIRHREVTIPTSGNSFVVSRYGISDGLQGFASSARLEDQSPGATGFTRNSAFRRERTFVSGVTKGDTHLLVASRAQPEGAPVAGDNVFMRGDHQLTADGRSNVSVTIGDISLKSPSQSTSLPHLTMVADGRIVGTTRTTENAGSVLITGPIGSIGTGYRLTATESDGHFFGGNTRMTMVGAGGTPGAFNPELPFDRTSSAQLYDQIGYFAIGSADNTRPFEERDANGNVVRTANTAAGVTETGVGSSASTSFTRLAIGMDNTAPRQLRTPLHVDAATLASPTQSASANNSFNLSSVLTDGGVFDGTRRTRAPEIGYAAGLGESLRNGELFLTSLTPTAPTDGLTGNVRATARHDLNRIGVGINLTSRDLTTAGVETAGRDITLTFAGGADVATNTYRGLSAYVTEKAYGAVTGTASSTSTAGVVVAPGDLARGMPSGSGVRSDYNYVQWGYFFGDVLREGGRTDRVNLGHYVAGTQPEEVIRYRGNAPSDYRATYTGHVAATVYDHTTGLRDHVGRIDSTWNFNSRANESTTVTGIANRTYSGSLNALPEVANNGLRNTITGQLNHTATAGGTSIGQSTMTFNGQFFGPAQNAAPPEMAGTVSIRATAGAPVHVGEGIFIAKTP